MQNHSRPSPNFNDRPAGESVDAVILHYTGMQTAQAALDRLTAREAGVSAHYLLDTDGTLYTLVSEDKRAWHAGVSYWRGADNLNHTSIGIEIVNPGHEFGYQAFPNAQIESLLHLLAGITARWQIDPRCIVGHSDIAPTRKIDPGEFFPWHTLAQAGFGLWPERLKGREGQSHVAASHAPLPALSNPTPAGLTAYYSRQQPAPLAEAAPLSVAAARSGLKQIGYHPQAVDDDVALVVAVFQQHWRPANCSGALDDETLAAISAVADLFRGA